MSFSPCERGHEIQHLKSVFKGKPDYRAEDGTVLLIADISFREREPFCQPSVGLRKCARIYFGGKPAVYLLLRIVFKSSFSENWRNPNAFS